MGAAVIPAVSIILPVRNAMPYLPEALDAVVGQTFSDFEFLVQDDGSTDGSLECARALAEKDSRVLVASGPPRGVAHAANAAAERARGHLYVRIDADDVSVPERIERQVEYASEHPEVGLFGSRVRFFPRDTLTDGMQRYESWINGVLTHAQILRDRFVELPVAQPSWALRPEVFARVGGYRDGLFPEDYDFFLRAVDAGVRFGKHPDVLLNWRDHPARLSRNAEAFSPRRFFERKLRSLLPLLGQRARPVAIVGAGDLGKRWARRLGEEGVDVRHFLDVHPGRIGATIHGAEVLSYGDLERVRDCFLLLSVGRSQGRAEIRRRLEAAGLAEEDHFLSIQ